MTIAATSLPPAASQTVAGPSTAAAPSAGFGEAVDSALAPSGTTAAPSLNSTPAACSPLIAGSALPTIAGMATAPGKAAVSPAQPTVMPSDLTGPVIPQDSAAPSEGSPAAAVATADGTSSSPKPTAGLRASGKAQVALPPAVAELPAPPVGIGPALPTTTSDTAAAEDSAAPVSDDGESPARDAALPETTTLLATAQPAVAMPAIVPAAMLPVLHNAGGAVTASADGDAPSKTAAGPTIASTVASSARMTQVEQASSADPSAPATTGFAERLAAQVPALAPRHDGTGAAAANPSLLAASQPAATPAAPAPVATLASAHQLPTVTAQAGQIGREMGVVIARRVTDGGNELTVRLNPAAMGRIEVKLAFDDRGTLRATVAAESPAALDLLRRDSADLGRALTDAGVRADAQSFRFDSRAGSNSSGGQSWQRPGGSQQGGQNTAGRGYAGDTGADEPLYRALRTSGRVDLMA